MTLPFKQMCVKSVPVFVGRYHMNPVCNLLLMIKEPLQLKLIPQEGYYFNKLVTIQHFHFALA